MQTPVKGDFPTVGKPSQFAPCMPLGVPRRPNQHTAEEGTMNNETLELNAVAEVAKTEESIEFLALSVDDLDLVGGGCHVGNAF